MQQATHRRVAPVLAALILLLSTVAAQELQIDNYEAGSDSGGGATTAQQSSYNPAGTLPQVQDTQWLSGWWDMEPYGVDATMGYDSITRDLYASAALPNTSADGVAAADQLVDYQLGRATGSMTIDHHVPLLGDSVTKYRIALMHLQPGSGWFTGIDREPETPPGNTFVVGTDLQWERRDGEFLTVELVKTAGNCLGSPPSGSRDVLLGSSEDIDVELRIEAVENTEQVYSQQFFRTDRMDLLVFVDATLFDCSFDVKVAWNLEFSYEAPVEPPSDDSDPYHDPTLYADGDHFWADARVWEVGTYTTQARIDVAAGQGQTAKYDPPLAPDGTINGPDAPLNLHMLYAPVLPLNYVCDRANAITEVNCVHELLNGAPESNLVVQVGPNVDGNGMTIYATEVWNGFGITIAHHITDTGLLDLGASVVYKRDQAGTIQLEAYL